jgi:RNA polymerase sigma factor (sigma-70 family)
VVAAMSGGAARDQLVEESLPLIGSIARVYRGSPSIDRDELIQAGVVGVLCALERYDPQLGTPFWAYASWWVRQAMQQLVSELSGPVVLSDRAVRHLTHVRDAQREYFQAHGREPTMRELAIYTGMPLSQVESLMVAHRNARGLEEPSTADAESGTTVGELLIDPRSDQAYERVPDFIVAERLPELLALLSERERLVILGRFGMEGKERTLRDLAATLGLSAERVRQIERVALRKLWQAASGPPEPVDVDK